MRMNCGNLNIDGKLYEAELPENAFLIFNNDQFNNIQVDAYRKEYEEKFGKKLDKKREQEIRSYISQINESEINMVSAMRKALKRTLERLKEYAREGEIVKIEIPQKAGKGKTISLNSLEAMYKIPGPNGMTYGFRCYYVDKNIMNEDNWDEELKLGFGEKYKNLPVTEKHKMKSEWKKKKIANSIKASMATNYINLYELRQLKNQRVYRNEDIDRIEQLLISLQHNLEWNYEKKRCCFTEISEEKRIKNEKLIKSLCERWKIQNAALPQKKLEEGEKEKVKRQINKVIKQINLSFSDKAKVKFLQHELAKQVNLLCSDWNKVIAELKRQESWDEGVDFKSKYQKASYSSTHMLRLDQLMELRDLRHILLD